MMGQLLKYIGSDTVLGEIAKDGGFYWLVHPYIETTKKQKVIDPTKVVCHAKWTTEIIKRGDWND